MIQQCDRCGAYWETEDTICPKCGWNNLETIEPDEINLPEEK